MPAANATELVNLLFLRHADALHGYVVGLAGGDTGLADDVVQEVFLVVSRRAADFRQDADFLCWIRGIARNTVKLSACRSSM
jgi:DNA-directed RNA polymerase specialized sigma24 family protein